MFTRLHLALLEMTALALDLALSTGAKLVGLAFLVAVGFVGLSVLRDILTARYPDDLS